MLDGEATVKRYYREDGSHPVAAGESDMAPIYATMSRSSAESRPSSGAYSAALFAVRAAGGSRHAPPRSCLRPRRARGASLEYRWSARRLRRGDCSCTSPRLSASVPWITHRRQRCSPPSALWRPFWLALPFVDVALAPLSISIVAGRAFDGGLAALRCRTARYGIAYLRGGRYFGFVFRDVACGLAAPGARAPSRESALSRSLLLQSFPLFAGLRSARFRSARRCGILASLGFLGDCFVALFLIVGIALAVVALRDSRTGITGYDRVAGVSELAGPKHRAYPHPPLPFLVVISLFLFVFPGGTVRRCRLRCCRFRASRVCGGSGV